MRIRLALAHAAARLPARAVSTSRFSPSVQTLKSIRKWRDRGFVLRERLLERWQLPAGKRILFTPWPDAVDSLTQAFAGTRHEYSFGAIPPGGGDYDLVVPFSVEDLLAVCDDEQLRARNPLPLPTRAAIELCDDKAALNEHLRAHGFARHVPADVAAGSHYPYMLKRCRDAFARHAYRIAGPEDEAAHTDAVASPDYLRQEWIDGDTEFSAHLLFWGGRIQRALTVSFLMQPGGAVRGRDRILLHRRCSDRHLGLFADMLRSVGFEGLCCVNYKERTGTPLVLEINPRCGFTLTPFFPVFLRSLRWR